MSDEFSDRMSKIIREGEKKPAMPQRSIDPPTPLVRRINKTVVAVALIVALASCAAFYIWYNKDNLAGKSAKSDGKDNAASPRGQVDNPDTIRKEVRDILAGEKKSTADSLDDRRKRMASISKVALDQWETSLKSSREQALGLLMNYDRLYKNNEFQKEESDRIRKLYDTAK